MVRQRVTTCDQENSVARLCFCFDRSQGFADFYANTGAQPCPPLPDTGAVFVVSSRAEFDTAIAAAVDGDTIRVTGGPHDWGAVILSKAVTIKPDGATAVFNGTSYFQPNQAATLYGLSFQPVGPPTSNRYAVQMFGERSRVLCCDFTGAHQASPQVAPVPACVRIAAADCEVAHNTFADHSYNTFGIQINSSFALSGLRAHVHHNTLSNDHVYTGAQGGEAINCGVDPNLSTQALIEWNRMEVWGSDPETLGIKTSDNVIRFNYAAGNEQAFGHWSQRVGNRNLWYANWYDGAWQGWRVNGSDNCFIWNYSKSSGAGFGVFMFADTAEEPGAHGNLSACNIYDGFINGYAGTNNQSTFQSPPSNNVLDGDTFVNVAHTLGADGYGDPGSVVDHAAWLAAGNFVNSGDIAAVVGGKAEVIAKYSYAKDNAQYGRPRQLELIQC